MKSHTGENLAGVPAPVPGQAEGEANIDDQSKVPPSSHTPGSAEGEDPDKKPEATTAPDKEESA